MGNLNTAVEGFINALNLSPENDKEACQLISGAFLAGYAASESSHKKHVLTVKELGEQIGVSLPKAYELTEQAGFPVLRVGRKKLVPVEAFERWLNNQTAQQEA